MENCIFCKIVKGEIPAYKVWEDATTLAFLTIKPIKQGHVLLIPKTHQNYYFELDDETITDLSLKSKPVAEAIKKAFKPRSGKVAMIIMGMGVPHVHLHLLPLDKESDFLDTSKEYESSQEELKDAQQKITKSLS